MEYISRQFSNNNFNDITTNYQNECEINFEAISKINIIGKRRFIEGDKVSSNINKNPKNILKDENVSNLQQKNIFNTSICQQSFKNNHQKEQTAIKDNDTPQKNNKDIIQINSYNKILNNNQQLNQNNKIDSNYLLLYQKKKYLEMERMNSKLGNIIKTLKEKSFKNINVPSKEINNQEKVLINSTYQSLINYLHKEKFEEKRKSKNNSDSIHIININDNSKNKSDSFEANIINKKRNRSTENSDESNSFKNISKEFCVIKNDSNKKLDNLKVY